MPRKVTLSFDDGTQHIYDNVPDDITPDQIQSRASNEFSGKTITNIDGGKKQKSTAQQAKDSFKPVASAVDSLYGIVPGVIGEVGYVGGRLLGQTQQEAEKNVAAVHKYMANPIGKATGITEDAAYTDPLKQFGEWLSPKITSAANTLNYIATGNREHATDIEHGINIGAMLAGPKVAKGAGKVAAPVIEKGAQAVAPVVEKTVQGAKNVGQSATDLYGYGKGVVGGMGELGQGNYRVPVTPELQQQLNLNPTQKTVIEPGMAGRQLGNDIMRSGKNPITAGALMADALGGGGLATAVTQAPKIGQAIRDVRQSRAQIQDARAVKPSAPTEPAPVAPNIPNAIDSGFADLLKGETPTITSKMPVEPKPLQLGWDGKPQAPVEQPPIYVTPRGTATADIGLAEKASINERIGADVFPEAGGLRPSVPKTVEQVPAPSVQQQASKYQRQATVDNEAPSQYQPEQSARLQELKSLDPTLEGYTKSYVVPEQIRHQVDTFVSGRSKDTLAYGGPGTGKTSLAGEYIGQQKPNAVEYVSRQLAEDPKELARIKQTTDLNEKVLIVIDEADTFTPGQIEKLREVTERPNVQTLYTTNNLNKVPEGIKNRATNTIDMNTVLTPAQKEAHALSLAQRYNIDKTPDQIREIANKSETFRDLYNNVTEGKMVKKEPVFAFDMSSAETLPVKPEIKTMLQDFVDNKTSRNVIIVDKSVYDAHPEFSTDLNKVMPPSTLDNAVNSIVNPSSASPTFRVIIESKSDATKLSALKGQIERNNKSDYPTKLIIEDKLGLTDEALHSRAMSLTKDDLHGVGAKVPAGVKEPAQPNAKPYTGRSIEEIRNSAKEKPKSLFEGLDE